MIQILTLLAASAACVQAEPTLVSVTSSTAETSIDLWEELRQVDPAFKALGDDVVRIAKGLESDEIEARTKATAQLKALGLTAYGPIKSLRDKVPSESIRPELDAVLKSLAGHFDTALAPLPGARRIGEKETEALRARLQAKQVLRQHAKLTLFDGQRGNTFIGDARPIGLKVRSISIEGDGASARLDPQGLIIKSGYTLEILPKVDDKNETATLEIKATSRSSIGQDPTEVTVRVTPHLRPKEGFLVGPFPSADEKGAPWWLFVIEIKIIN